MSFDTLASMQLHFPIGENELRKLQGSVARATELFKVLLEQPDPHGATAMLGLQLEVIRALVADIDYVELEPAKSDTLRTRSPTGPLRMTPDGMVEAKPLDG